MLTLTMFSVATRCLGFIYKIYLTKIMTTTELGIYNLTISVYMVLLTIVASSIPLTISKITAQNRSIGRNTNTHHSVTSSLILSSLIAITLCILLLISKPLLILLLGDNSSYQIIISLLPSVIFTALYSQIRGYLWGLENYFAVSIVEFIEQIIKIILCFLFILTGKFSSPILAVSTAINISCGLSTIFGFYLYYKNSGKFSYKSGYFKEIIKSSLPLSFVRLLGSMLQPIIAILIPLRLSSALINQSEALGLLGIIMGMTMPLLSIPSTIIGALCMILIPKISGNDKSQVNSQINYYILFTISCVFVFIPIFIVLGEPACEFIFSNTQAGVFLKQSAWVMIPMGLSQISTSILNALGKETRAFLIFLINSVILIAFTYIFTPILSIQVMTIGIGISGIVTTILNFIIIKKILHTKTFIIKNILLHTLISLPIILFTKYTYGILSKVMSSFLCLGFTSIISLLSFIILLFVFGIISPDILSKYLSKAKTLQTRKKCP